ncbi:TPA: ecotin family protein [Vibrio parahaemolyticus]
MTIKLIALVISSSMFSFSASASDVIHEIGEDPLKVNHENIKMYKEAPNGFVRHLVALSPLANEHDAKIELMFKKPTMSDCNVRGWFGKLTEETVKGWGYNTYTLDDKIPMASTMMFCNEEPELKMLYSQPQDLMRYNSRLPIVVYTPSGVEMDVRVWQPTITK